MVAVFIFTFSLAESYVFLCHLLFISSVLTDIKPVKKTQYLFISGVICCHFFFNTGTTHFHYEERKYKASSIVLQIRQITRNRRKKPELDR